MAKRNPKKKPLPRKRNTSSQPKAKAAPKPKGPQAWYMNILPHVGILLAGLIIVSVFCAPVFEGKVVNMDDIAHFKGMAREVKDYRDQTGEEALWSDAIFGGMPTFQMGLLFPNNLMKKVDTVLHLGLPRPVNYYFFMFAGFFFLMVSLRVNPWVSGIGALAFTFSSYFFVIIDVGHTSKTNAISYMAPVLMGVLMAYRGKPILGGALTALFLALQINANHFQITYYLSFIVFIVVIAYLVDAIQQNKLADYIKASSILLLAAGLALGPNVSRLWTSYEYAAESIRGKSDLSSAGDEGSGGVDIKYATDWSYGKSETFTLMIPNFYGGATGGQLGKGSEVYENYKSQGASEKQALDAAKSMPTYWGPQSSTSGPVYVGSIICFLFLLGMFVVKGKARWWLLAATLLSMMLSWGHHMLWFTKIFFHYYPMYSKFRAVSMTLVIAELTMPILATLALYKIVEKKDELQEQLTIRNLLIAAGITGGLSLFFAALGSAFFDFEWVAVQLDPNNPNMQVEIPRDQQVFGQNPILDAVKGDRQSMLQTDAFRSFIFIALSALTLFLFIKDRIKKELVYVAFALLVLVDMWPVAKRYLNSDSFVTKSNFMAEFTPTAADQAIKQDPDNHYRVLNFAVSTFNDAITSYHHNSTGGYNAAKLQRYQELIEQHISPEMQRIQSSLSQGNLNGNWPVVNMMNTKYFILPLQQGQVKEFRNPNALGDAWFVNQLKFVENADAEIAALRGFNPKETAIVDQKWKEQIGSWNTGLDSSATIQLKNYSPNELSYEYSSSQEQIAIFSEVYYDGGSPDPDWKVYINGEEASHFRANYVLRGMKLPAGKGEIKFEFRPQSYYQGETYALIFSIVIFLFVAVAIAFEVMKMRQAKPEEKTDTDEA